MNSKDSYREEKAAAEAPFWTRLRESFRYFALLATLGLIIFLVLRYNLYGFPMLMTVLACIGAGVLVNAVGTRFCRLMEEKTGVTAASGPEEAAEEAPPPETAAAAEPGAAGDGGGMRAQLRDMEAAYLRSFGLEPGSGEAGSMFPAGWQDGADIKRMRALLEAIDRHVPVAETEVWTRELSEDAR